MPEVSSQSLSKTCSARRLIRLSAAGEGREATPALMEAFRRAHAQGPPGSIRVPACTVWPSEQRPPDDTITDRGFQRFVMRSALGLPDVFKNRIIHRPTGFFAFSPLANKRPVGGSLRLRLPEAGGGQGPLGRPCRLTTRYCLKRPFADDSISANFTAGFREGARGRRASFTTSR